MMFQARMNVTTRPEHDHIVINALLMGEPQSNRWDLRMKNTSYHYEEFENWSIDNIFSMLQFMG